MVTKTALLLRKPLLFFALRTTAIHFSTVQVILKEKTTTGTFTCSRLNCCPTSGNWTLKDSFTVTAPELPLQGFLALLTSFNGHLSLQHFIA
jgi:hypothetical protein